MVWHLVIFKKHTFLFNNKYINHLSTSDAPVEELQEKDAIPLGESEESLQLPMEKVLTTPAVRKMAVEHKVNIFSCAYIPLLSYKIYIKKFCCHTRFGSVMFKVQGKMVEF
jgi:hypothetical protein